MRQLFWLCVLAAAFSSVWADVRPAASQNKDAAKPDDTKSVVGDQPAEPGQPTAGYLIRVDLPITGDVDTRIRAAVTKILSNLPRGGPRPVLVLELWPGQTEGGVGSDFFRSMSLARFLSSRDLAGVKTVAYLPKTVKGHGVLVPMACEEIVMAPDAELGEAGIDEQTIGPTIRSGYKEIADARRTIPPAVALAMLDKDLTALKVTTEVGTEYVLADELDDLKQRRVVQATEELKPRPFLFDGRRGRQELGLVSYLADDRADLAHSLGLSPASLQDNPALTGGWQPVQVDIKHAITAKDVNIVQRKIEDQIRENDVNLVVLWIDSDGGSYTDSLRLATFLSSLKPGQVRTVAYVPRSARRRGPDRLGMQPDCDEP